MPESEYVKSLNLDIDTRRLLALRIDDILFGDADKWVKQIEESDYITNEVARTTPTTKGRFLKDEIGDSLGLYKTERMRYMGILNDYRLRLVAFNSWEKQLPEIREKASANSLIGTLAEAEATGRELTFMEGMAKLMLDAPRENVVIGAEYLEEGRVRKFLAARAFLNWIYKAFGCGALVPGEGLQRKLAECNKLASELETNYQELVREYTLLEAEDSQLEWDYNTLYQQYHIHELRNGRRQ